MTRVNAVPVEELTDQHLIAEYREITMVPASLQRTLRSKAGFDPNKISPEYTLNSGHVYFFYDKGRFLQKRYRQLCAEMRKRGFFCNKARSFPIKVFKDNGLFNDWEITKEAENLSRCRIQTKIDLKPKWYRKTPHKR